MICNYILFPLFIIANYAHGFNIPKLYSYAHYYHLPGRINNLFKETQCYSINRNLNPHFELDSDSFRSDIQNIGIAAARKAGDLMIKGLGSINLQNDVYSKIGSRDIVTMVDKNAQEIIQSTISSAFPNHTFLGEEDVEPGIESARKAIDQLQNAEHLWIVDPLDGTTNFAHGTIAATNSN